MHALIVPRRHATTYFDLHHPERRAINLLLDQVRLNVLAADKAVEGFNVGMNCGKTVGHTIMHCHVYTSFRVARAMSISRAVVFVRSSQGTCSWLKAISLKP
jgi:hypothetical protein